MENYPDEGNDTGLLSRLIAQLPTAPPKERDWLLNQTIPMEMLAQNVWSHEGVELNIPVYARARKGQEDAASAWLRDNHYKTAKAAMHARLREGRTWPPEELFEIAQSVQ